ncbi:MAG: chemotaxis protein CheD [Nitrospirae bacterium]|nr:chemotaxis protein CheD [Nitrospirota bacterium]
MMRNYLKIKRVYLKPGEMHFAESPTIVTTVLGSCVSVVMYSTRNGVGAICHGMLPTYKGKMSFDLVSSEGLRYVDFAIERMLKKFHDKGIAESELDVKLFGGAEMLPNSQSGTNLTVGRQNIEIARKIIDARSLDLVTFDVGGLQGRKIIFHTHTGDVYLKRLRKTEYLETLE